MAKKTQSKKTDVQKYVIKRRHQREESEARLLSVMANVAKAEEPSAAQDDEEIHGLGVGHKKLIKPIYHPLVLTEFLESSSELRQVVAAMIANTVGYGFRIVPREHATKNKDTLLDEEIELENFFSYINPDQSFLQVMEAALWDYYLTGNMYFEIIRNGKGKPASIVHIPSYQVRISKREDEAALLKMTQLIRSRNGYEIRKRLESKRFRKFAQTNRVSSRIGTVSDGQGVWFKEFQDSRVYDRKTGELATTAKEIKDLRRKKQLAHEIVHVSAPQTRGVYGLPYYIGNVISINGDIKAENINMSTFSNNNIPSMVVAVSGGQLTPGSLDRIAEFSESKFQHSDNRSKFLLLESETMDDDSLDTGRSRIEIKSLHETQKEEAMFQKYSEECRAAIRRSFRLPEILVGRGSAASGVVVAASMKLADEQVFSQDRTHFVDWINRKLLPELGILNLMIELNSPNATDPATIVNLLGSSEKTGAMTPRIARDQISRLLGIRLPDFEENGQFDPDIPFTLTQAEAVKKVNEAGLNNPTGSNEPEKEITGADQTQPSQTITSERSGDGGGS